MIYTGIAQWCLDRAGIDAVYRAAELGFSGIQIDAGGVDQAPLLDRLEIQEQYLKAVQDTSLAITGISVNILNDYGMKNPRASKEFLACWEMIQLAIDAAEKLQVKLVFLPSFDKGEITDEQELINTAALLRKACIYAARHQVVIATENSLGIDGNRRLLATTHHPVLMILLDTLNPVLRGHDVPGLIKELWPYICNQIHIKDGVDGMMGNVPLGEGVAGLMQTARVLQDMGFSGYLICENDYFQDTASLVKKDLEFIRKMFDSADFVRR